MNATCFWQQQALGAAVSLLPRSPRYRDMRLKDVERRLVPAISRGQIKFYVADGEPQAFATWAYLTREAADGLLTGERDLVDADFDAGEETWLIDLVAAPGKALPVVRDLRGTVFAGRSLRRLRRGADRSWRCVHMWRVQDAGTARPTSGEALAALVARHARFMASDVARRWLPPGGAGDANGRRPVH